jgi:NAD(P)-dependent dehydrogenase (short-subunit alcohol dehydrogenase family)
MKGLPAGRIVNVASTAGLTGYAYTTAYGAAKHAVVGFTRSLAKELARTAITVNAVCPSFTDTDLVARSLEVITEKSGRSREAALSELTANNPQGRLVRPEEVAQTVVWLCSDAAAAVSGQAIAIDGGETA